MNEKEIFLGVVGLALYFVPSIVAKVRRHKNVVPIELVNIFFGWTVIGWVVALAWAASSQEKK